MHSYTSPTLSRVFNFEESKEYIKGHFVHKGTLSFFDYDAVRVNFADEKIVKFSVDCLEETIKEKYGIEKGAMIISNNHIDDSYRYKFFYRRGEDESGVRAVLARGLEDIQSAGGVDGEIRVRFACRPIVRGLCSGMNHQRDILSQNGKKAVDLLPIADVKALSPVSRP